MSTDNDASQDLGEPATGVGYGKPPQSTRFKKGTSGNPKGRPKGTLNLTTVFAKTLREKVVINEHGQRKTVTKFEAAVKQLVNKSCLGRATLYPFAPRTGVRCTSQTKPAGNTTARAFRRRSRNYRRHSETRLENEGRTFCSAGGEQWQP